MKVLVTGGAGRLGAMVVRSLKAMDQRIVVFDLPNADYSRLSPVTGIDLCKGDITRVEQLEKICEGVDMVLHLAAILPPQSERNLERTMHVSATGTETLVRALESASSAPIVFSSSVCVYGRTHNEDRPITTRHPLVAIDNYSKSKIAAEKAIRDSKIKYMVLRISGAYSAEPFEFPSPVQFKPEQRVEFIDMDDAATALAAAVKGEIDRKTLNIAGGESWRMTGEHFVCGVFEAFGVRGEVNYPQDYGYFDWYDTEESQELLQYQRTPFSLFKKKLPKIFGIQESPTA